MNLITQLQNQSDGSLHLDRDRATELYRQIVNACDMAVSLASMTKLFPNITLSQGEIHPALVVEGVAKALEERLGEALSIIDGDDLKQAEREERHAQN